MKEQSKWMLDDTGGMSDAEFLCRVFERARRAMPDVEMTFTSSQVIRLFDAIIAGERKDLADEKAFEDWWLKGCYADAQVQTGKTHALRGWKAALLYAKAKDKR